MLDRPITFLSVGNCYHHCLCFPCTHGLDSTMWSILFIIIRGWSRKSELGGGKKIRGHITRQVWATQVAFKWKIRRGPPPKKFENLPLTWCIRGHSWKPGHFGDKRRALQKSEKSTLLYFGPYITLVQMGGILPRFWGHLAQNLGHFAPGGGPRPLCPPTGSAPDYIQSRLSKTDIWSSV